MLGHEIANARVKITPAQCAKLISSMMVHFWETKMEESQVAQFNADWYMVLQAHTERTVMKACRDWLGNAKRKPMPADILSLCDELDSDPTILSRLRLIVQLPVNEEPEVGYDYENEPMNGDPIILARFIGHARAYNINFPIYDQMAYLSTGLIPEWGNQAIVIDNAVKKELATREELLAQMTPEERIAALK